MKIMLTIAIALALMGCGEEFGTSETSETVNTEIPANAMTIEAGGDVTVTQVGGDYIITTSTESTSSGALYDSADYDPNYSQATCLEKRFFWCAAEEKCLNQPADTGTCSASAYEVKVIW